MLKNNLITQEDLNWLYYGDENDQIIAKLINEENNFKKVIDIKIALSAVTITINNILYNIIDTLRIKPEYYSNFNLNKDQIIRLYKLNEKYKFKSSNEDTKYIIEIIKSHYCFNDFLEPRKLNNTITDIKLLINKYGYKRNFIEIKEIIKDAFGYL